MEGGESAFETALSDGARTLDDLDEDVDMLDAETLEGDERNAVSSTDGGDGVEEWMIGRRRSRGLCRGVRGGVVEELHGVQVVSSRSDKIIWKPKPVEGFTVKGGYAWVQRERSVAPLLAKKYKEVCGCKIPLKVKAFSWLASREDLGKRCVLCGVVDETVSHLFTVYTIQDCGGQMTSDGKRFRTGGGILWNILKMREPKAYKEIMAKGREFEKKETFKGLSDPLEVPRVGDPLSFQKTIEATKQEAEDNGEPHSHSDEHRRHTRRKGNSEHCPSCTSRTAKSPSPEPNRDRVSVLNRIRVPVAYDDLFEEGEIGS
ncbi:hypothetical protein QJS10_CPA06g00930 [Acorus calamus]|uniref:Phosphorylated adapter RNA export protein n=1 Tax=Acorus calamus TaxID=4465 RepID=A0AAV9ELN1_ACOCL|nr:hypothetical protein QJS10_CPA06g00930 [Acorus calamus]